MKSFSPLMLVAGLIISSNTLATEPADTILTNATIYGHDNADTIAIRNGSIMFVGNKANTSQLQNNNTQIIDLEHAFVMPGFIDNHNHVFEAASEVGGNCELSMDASLIGQIPYLKACQTDGDSNQWLMGYGFSLEAILNEDNHLTPLEVIDQIFPSHPVIIMEQTSHSMWVNSAALKLAGITKETPEPQGGKILRDPDSGELNGILLDNAGDLMMEIAWNNLENQFSQSYSGLMAGLAETTSYGITTIGDGRLYWKRGWYEVWKQAEKDGNLTARVSLRPWIYPTDSMEAQLTFLKTVQSSNPSNLLLIDQVKMYSDGITINGTAKTLDPYLTTYIPDEPYGINYIPPHR